MERSKKIKIYGTLVNNTLDRSLSGGAFNSTDYSHNDALAYAKQLYDDKFGDSTPVENFQDMINKRVTAIRYYEPGITVIENRDGSKANPQYMFIVKGNTNIGGKLVVDEGLDVTGPTKITGDLTVDGNTNISKKLVVGENTTIWGELHVDGDTHLHKNLQVAGDTNLKNLYVDNVVINNNVTGIKLNNIDDVYVPNPSDGQVLTFDGATGNWVSKPAGDSIKLEDLADTDSASPNEGDILYFDGNKWVPTNLIDLIDNEIKAKALWTIAGDNDQQVITVNSRSAAAKGFYDIEVS